MNDLSMITFEDTVKQYNKASIIGEIDLKVNKGEIFALCGGNGAGKSTLIKMLTGILKPTAGRILLHGKEINPTNKNYKYIFSYMPDVMLLPEQLTGREILRYFGKLRQVSSERVEEVLAMTGLIDVGDRLIKQYSKGMQQRLSLAQALLPEVELLILDEPTNGLDPYWVYRLKEILLEQQAQGKTIILTTHTLSFVEEVANRVAFLEDGKVIINDRVKHLIYENDEKISLEEVFLKRQMLRS